MKYFHLTTRKWKWIGILCVFAALLAFDNWTKVNDESTDTEAVVTYEKQIDAFLPIPDVEQGISSTTPVTPLNVHVNPLTKLHHRIDTLSDSKVALVLPFIPSQISRLSNQLALWYEFSSVELKGDFQRFNACTPNEPLAAITLVWYIDKDFNQETIDRINNVLLPSLGPMQSCFKEVKFLAAHLPDHLNRHPCGPCSMFFKLFDLLKDDYQYFFIMEPDVIPVKKYFLNAMTAELVYDFWMRGSTPQCKSSYGEIAERKDFHINGNGLFNIQGIMEYIERVKAFYPGGFSGCDAGCSTGKKYEGGHDHTMYQYRMHPLNYDYSKKVVHYFQVTEFIRNLCEGDYSYDQVNRIYPNTWLVHSKGPYLTEDRHWVRSMFQSLYSRYTDYYKEQWMVKALESNQKSRTDLLISECSSGAYLTRHTNNPSSMCLSLCGNQTMRNSYKKLCSILQVIESWSKYEKDKLYLWSTDFHAAPIACNSAVFKDAGAIVHAEIDFSNCGYFGVCKKRLKVLSFDNWRGFSLDPCPNKLRRTFFNHYKKDPEFQRVDGFICSHPVANCELYMPFNKTIIIYATTRLEFGRNDENITWRLPNINSRSRYRWAEWVTNLKRLAAHPTNIIAANNLYDANYIEYFTGIKVTYLPSWCGNPKVSNDYNPIEKTIIIGPYRDNLGHPYKTEAEAWNHTIFVELKTAIANSKSSYSFKRMREVYAHYKLDDLLKHPAMILIPYQVSFMSFFEFYRLGIPLFAPSKKLLLSWELDHNLVWERIYGHPEPVGPTESSLPYPNSKESFEQWVEFCDVYQFPHITLFDSWDDMITKLEETDLKKVHLDMLAYSQEQYKELVSKWRDIFDRIKALAPVGSRTVPMDRDFDEAMWDLYGAYPLGPDPEINGNTKCSN